ncbi:MAG: biosynthetic-type acetolactate synthase large subunit, partial [Clostridia bacterium]|nr:biosynthetic-type acetolactate synthase large subunit [Clostridia bacterium]
MQKNGSEIIMEVLLEQGVDTVFGYPGGTVLNIYDALYKYQDKITHVLTSHEQGAAHAADGYARASGKVGVCIATSGPGATNLVTGLATAYMDSVPVVAITGNVPTSLLGRDSFQEVDIAGVTMPITKHNYIVKDVTKLADTLRAAFRIANSGRKGPVLVDVPKDVSAMLCEYEPKAKVQPDPMPNLNLYKIETAAKYINEAERPMIYMGGGIVAAGAQEEIVRFAEKLQIPVASSSMGLGGFPGDHELFAGMIGMHGTYMSNKAVDDSDVLIVVGARFSDRVAGNRTGFAKNSKIIHIDLDPAELNKNVNVDLYITGDIKEALAALIERTNEVKSRPWTQEVKNYDNSKPMTTAGIGVNPQKVIEAISKMNSAESIMVTDVGQHQMWTAQYYKFRKPRTFISSGGLGTMGYGMGAAIGSQFANPDKRVVLITGDGSFHMNLNELATVESY